MSAERNKAVVAEILKAFETGDADAILEHLTPTANWWVAGNLPISGDHDRAGIKQLITGLASMTEGPLRFTPVTFVADSDRVSVEAESEANLKNGKHYANKYVLVFDFDGELVSRIREYIDTKMVHDLMFG